MEITPTVHQSDILKNVVAFVDVKSALGNPALAISSRLRSLGADVSHIRTANVTHVVFRHGSDTNKAWATKIGAYLVTPAWVKACHTYQCQMSENAFAVCDDGGEHILRESSEVPHESRPRADSISTVSDVPLRRHLRRSPKLDPLTVPPAIQRYFGRLQKPKRTTDEAATFSDSDSPDKDSTYNLSPARGAECNSMKDTDNGTIECGLDVPIAIPVPSTDEASTTTTPSHSSPHRCVKSKSTPRSDWSFADTYRKSPQSSHLSDEDVTHCLSPMGNRTPVDNLIKPFTSGRKPAAIFSSINRRRSLLNAKKRLSPNTPITPDFLINWVQNAHTPKTRRTALRKMTAGDKTPRSKRKEKQRLVKVVIERMTQPSNTVFSEATLKRTPARARTVNSQRTAQKPKHPALPSPKVKPSSLHNKSGVNSLAVACIDQSLITRLKKINANVEVDLDNSVAPSVANRPMATSPQPYQPASQNVRRASKSRFPPRSNSTVREGLHTKRRSGPTYLHPSTASRMERTGAGGTPRTVQTRSLHLEPITNRNSLDDFDLRSLPRAAIPDNFFVIGFTGLRRDEELTIRAILRSSSLQHYDLIGSFPGDPAITCISRPINVQKCTHLITVDPFRRTMNLLRGLLSKVKIVTTDWLLRSADIGVWLREKEFVPSGLPKHSRSRLLPTLFSKLGPIYVAPHRNPPRRDLIELLEMGGAQITNRQLRASLIIGPSITKVPGVRSTWIFDSIVHAKLLPLKSYVDEQ